MDDILISMIIPVYNSAEYLDDNIQSVVNQTYRHIEILYVDDGSEDSSLSIIDQYAKQDDRIRILSSMHGGVSVARNIGLCEAKGDLISFVDSDDVLENTFIENMMENLCKDDCPVCSFIEFGYRTGDYKKHYKNLDKNIDTIDLFHNLYKYHIVIPGICGSVWNKLFYADVIYRNQIRFEPDLTIGEDLLFCLKYFSKINTVRIVPESFYKYRIHKSQTTSKRKCIKHYAVQYKKMFDAVEEVLLENNVGVDNFRRDYALRMLQVIERSVININADDANELKELDELINTKYIQSALQLYREGKISTPIYLSFFLKTIFQSKNVKLLKIYGRIMGRIR